MSMNTQYTFSKHQILFAESATDANLEKINNSLLTNATQ